MVIGTTDPASSPGSPVRVDVLVTAFNAESTIREAVASLQAQTFRDIRIVVVDDGSTDGTVGLVTELAANDRRILLVQKPHSGIVDSLRVGLTHCDAPLLARFDADDLCNPDRVQRQVAELEAHPDWVAVASAARVVDEGGHWGGSFTRHAAPEAADPLWIPAREPYMLQPFLMMRRAALDAVGGYRLCEVAEDSDLYWRLRGIGRLVNTSDVLGDYRQHANSISSRSIVRGRRIAFWSQLIALSARRRELGANDLIFDEARLEAIAHATTLDEHCLRGTAGVVPGEQTRLRAAIAAKLIEVAAYRPFELEPGDCRFARRAFADARPLLSSANREALETDVWKTKVRLIFAGRWRAACLLDPAGFPRLLTVWARRTFLTEGLRRRLRRLVGAR